MGRRRTLTAYAQHFAKTYLVASINPVVLGGKLMLLE